MQFIEKTCSRATRGRPAECVNDQAYVEHPVRGPRPMRHVSYAERLANLHAPRKMNFCKHYEREDKGGCLPIHEPLVEFPDIVEDSAFAHVVPGQLRRYPLELLLGPLEVQPCSLRIHPLFTSRRREFRGGLRQTLCGFRNRLGHVGKRRSLEMAQGIPGLR